VGTLTRGENACFDFYIVDNATKEEVDLREVDDITLNVSGRYNCNFGSYSYPENIKSAQVEKFSEFVYGIDFSDIINNVKLYIDIVDENHELIDSFLFENNLVLDIAIDGTIGYFLNGSKKHGFLDLTGFDTRDYMFLGWDIDEDYEDCDNENRYNFLINKKNLSFFVIDDTIVRAVYQKRREYTIQMANDNYNSFFIVEYMGEKTTLNIGDSISVLEGHDIKVSCIPNDIKPYKFIKWNDGFENPHRVLNIGGDTSTISLKAYCELNGDDIEYNDIIDISSLNNFKTIYPIIKDNIFIDNYFFDDICINNCEIDILDDIPYIKIFDSGYIQIKSIDVSGNLRLLLNYKGGDYSFFIDDYKYQSSVVDKSEIIFEYNGGIMTFKGNNTCIFGLTIYKECVYDKGKCMLCFNSEDTLKFHPGELIVEGGVFVNGNPYGISPVKFATVTNVAPLIIK
jgi:hypothetical protein